MPVPRPRKLLAFFVGLFAVGGLTAERLVALARAEPTDFDDAYMYLRYAEHVLAGQGLAWNAGEEQVYGVTSLLHLAGVTVVRALAPGLSLAGVLGVASGAAALAFVAALVAVLTLGARDARLRGNWMMWALAMLALIPFHDAFVFHAGTGMDTMLSALANTVLVFATLRLRDRPTRATVAGAALAALLAVLARPDNVLCALFCPAFALTFAQGSPRWKLLGGFAAAAIALVAALATVAWLVLGSALPLAFFAKQPWYYGGFAGEFAWNPFGFLQVFAYSAGPFVVALIVFADREGWRRAAVLVAPALASIVVLFRFNQIMGHLGRFYYPFLPFFVVAGGLEFDRWLRRRPAWRTRALLERVGMAAIAVVGGALGLSVGAHCYGARAEAQYLEPVRGFHVPARAVLPEIDSWQAAKAIAAIARDAPGATLAMSEHGLPGAVAPRTAIIDVLGLHDPHVARHGFSAALLFARKPDLIWLPHADHTGMVRDIIGSHELWSHYVFYPDAFFHGVALRSDGPHRAALAELLAAQWQATYPDVPMTDYQAVLDD